MVAANLMLSCFSDKPKTNCHHYSQYHKWYCMFSTQGKQDTASTQFEEKTKAKLKMQRWCQTYMKERKSGKTEKFGVRQISDWYSELVVHCGCQSGIWLDASTPKTPPLTIGEAPFPWMLWLDPWQQPWFRCHSPHLVWSMIEFLTNAASM